MTAGSNKPKNGHDEVRWVHLHPWHSREAVCGFSMHPAVLWPSRTLRFFSFGFPLGTSSWYSPDPCFLESGRVTQKRKKYPYFKDFWDNNHLKRGDLKVNTSFSDGYIRRLCNSVSYKDFLFLLVITIVQIKVFTIVIENIITLC